MTKVYVVTTGSYSDYRICQVFNDEELAKKFADALDAADGYSDSNVEEYELRGTGFALPFSAVRVTRVSHDGTSATTIHDSMDADECGSDVGRAVTRVTGGGLPLESFEVRTYGDALKVPQAHSDAVAKLRSERMGL